jgi:hypothetical protein
LKIDEEIRVSFVQTITETNFLKRGRRQHSCLKALICMLILLWRENSQCGAMADFRIYFVLPVATIVFCLLVSLLN